MSNSNSMYPQVAPSTTTYHSVQHSVAPGVMGAGGGVEEHVGECKGGSVNPLGIITGVDPLGITTGVEPPGGTTGVLSPDPGVDPPGGTTGVLSTGISGVGSGGTKPDVKGNPVIAGGNGGNGGIEWVSVHGQSSEDQLT